MGLSRNAAHQNEIRDAPAQWPDGEGFRPATIIEQGHVRPARRTPAAQTMRPDAPVEALMKPCSSNHAVPTRHHQSASFRTLSKGRDLVEAHFERCLADPLGNAPHQPNAIGAGPFPRRPAPERDVILAGAAWPAGKAEPAAQSMGLAVSGGGRSGIRQKREEVARAPGNSKAPLQGHLPREPAGAPP